MQYLRIIAEDKLNPIETGYAMVDKIVTEIAIKHKENQT